MNTKHILPSLLLALTTAVCLHAQQLPEQSGYASYYSDRFHGRRMSNGELYHRDSMTCAHLHYPMGTLLLVRNLTNGKEVVVRVTDRGPYSRKFVIDLSRAAARELDIIRWGYRPVLITPYLPLQIPYKYIATEKPVELDLAFSGDDVDGPPEWMDDSIYYARHRLSRTFVPHVEPDSLSQPLRTDTTLRSAVRPVAVSRKRRGLLHK